MAAAAAAAADDDDDCDDDGDGDGDLICYQYQFLFNCSSFTELLAGAAKGPMDPPSPQIWSWKFVIGNMPQKHGEMGRLRVRFQNNFVCAWSNACLHINFLL